MTKSDIMKLIDEKTPDNDYYGADAANYWYECLNLLAESNEKLVEALSTIIDTRAALDGEA